IRARRESGELLLRCSVRRKQLEKTRPPEHLAHTGGRIDNLQHAVHGRRHVECPDQLSDASGIDSRNRRKIDDDPALSMTETIANVMTQCPTRRHTKWIVDVHDGVSFGT